MLSLTKRRSLAVLAGIIVAGFSAPTHAQSFTFLDPDFTQELWGVHNGFLGGVAFATDTDALSNSCQFGGSPLYRWDTDSTVVVNGTTIHVALPAMPSNAGCGMTNNPDGFLYTNTGAGVVRLDPNTGAQIGSVFGSAGNALGITTDPQSNDLVYVGNSGTLFRVDTGFTTLSTYSTVATNDFIDGVYFDPTGNFLFLANRTRLEVTIIDRAGALVQRAPLGAEPDGIAFHEKKKIVVTNNLNGTLTRLDFPNGDFTLTPTASIFASGGFRGDLSQVGPDGCLYLTQGGTRYDDGTVTGENSVVRICPDFVIPPGSCAGTIVNYGAGLAGTGGLVPMIEGSCPIIGRTFDVDITNGRPGGWGCLAFGPTQTSMPFFGGTMLVNITNSITHFLDGMGELTISKQIPNDMGLIGLDFFMQAGYFDRGAPQNISLTDGLQATFAG